MGRIVFDQPYDDPYRLLACHLASVLSLHALNRFMTDTSFIKSLVMSEAKQIDISGPFLDCVDQEVISNDRIRQKNASLRALGEFYYNNLDIPRIRSELKKFVQDECGVALDGK